MAAKKSKRGKARKTGKRISSSKNLGSINPLRANYWGSEKA